MMRKPSLFQMFALSIAVHGVLLAGGWMAVKALFRFDVGERVMAVFTADFYKAEEPREEAEPQAPPRHGAAVEKSASVKNVKKKPRPSGPVAGAAAAPAASSEPDMDPELQAMESETSAVPQAGQAVEAPSETTGGEAAVKDEKGASEKHAVSQIYAAVKNAVVYPHMARKHGIEGTVRVSFHVAPGGWPSKIRVEKSSGFDILDQAAVLAVKNGKPYPSIAKAVEIPIRFCIQESSQ